MRRVRDRAIGIALFCALGLAVQIACSAAHLRFSAAVAALLVALVAIAVRRRIDAPVARGASSLLTWFPLFFVPACAGIIDLGPMLHTVWLAVGAILIVSTLLGLLAGVACGAALRGSAG